MKSFRFTLIVLTGLFSNALYSQLTFTLIPSHCVGGTVNVVANTGTMTALAYSWAAVPAGPVFSTPSSSTTNISFPTAGTYTIGVGILTANGPTYTANTIIINASPALTLNSTASTICPNQSATLTAGGATNYSWIPSASLSASTGSQVTASPAVTTVYTVTGSNSGCTSDATITVNVEVPQTIAATAMAVCPGFNSTLTAFGLNSYTWTGTGITNPVPQQSIAVGSGNYTVSGTSAAGCATSTSIVIGVAPPLNMNITQSSGTTCITSNFPKFSKPVHLTGSGAGSYVWFPYNPAQPSMGNQIDVRPTTTTCYTVVGTTAICQGSAVVCVTVIPQFSIGVAPLAPTICLNDHIQLGIMNVGASASGPSSAFTYSWTEALNAPPISLSSYFTSTVTAFPQNSTTYSVEMRDAVNCISLPETINITVNPCTGIKENISEQNDFIIYPNPATSGFYVKSGLTENIDIEVFDVLGKVIISKQTDGKEQSFLSIQDFKNGIYIVILKDLKKNTLFVQRIIKE